MGKKNVSKSQQATKRVNESDIRDIDTISVNGPVSYLGAEIKRWCQSSNTTGGEATAIAKKEIFNKYFHSSVEYPANPYAYYFVCYGQDAHVDSNYSLKRNLQRSPRPEKAAK
jgi:hypothetical protein